MRIRLFAILFFIAFTSVYATHNRSGYISYCYVGGGVYHFKIYTYTNASANSGPSGPDRCEQTLYTYAGIVGVDKNCTPIIKNPPIQNACAGQPWCYNPGATDDPENDSLDFSIIRSYEADPNNSPNGVEPIGIETFPAGLSVDK